MTQSRFKNVNSGNNSFMALNNTGNFEHNRNRGNNSIDFHLNRTKTQPNI